MGIASMVIGIVAFLVALFPVCGTWMLIPALVGLGLGIAEVLSKQKPKQHPARKMAIVGLVLNPLAVLIIIGWWIFLLSGAAEAASGFDSAFQKQWMQGLQQLQQQSGGIPGPGGTTPPVQPPPTPAQMKPMQPVDPPPSDTDSSSAPDPSAPTVPSTAGSPSATLPPGASPPTPSSLRPVGL